MQLGGYMKLTLQDYPGRVAAMCFTRSCQLRCPYCHNAELVLSNGQNSNVEGERLTLTFLSYLEKRKCQLDGVVVSGGEPLLQDDIQGFLHNIKEMGLEVKLDTNGLLPNKLRELIDNGLVDYVALDYKNNRENLAETVGLSRSEHQTIADSYYNAWRASLNCLRENRVPYELRTTVVRELHSIEVLLLMAESLHYGKNSQERWFLQSFVRKGPIMCDYTNNKTKISAYSNEEMDEIRRELLRLVPGIQLRG